MIFCEYKINLPSWFHKIDLKIKRAGFLFENTKKPLKSADFNGLSGAYGTWTHGLLNAIQARSQLRQCPKQKLVYQKQ